MVNALLLGISMIPKWFLLHLIWANSITGLRLVRELMSLKKTNGINSWTFAQVILPIEVSCKTYVCTYVLECDGYHKKTFHICAEKSSRVQGWLLEQGYQYLDQIFLLVGQSGLVVLGWSWSSQLLHMLAKTLQRTTKNLLNFMSLLRVPVFFHLFVFIRITIFKWSIQTNQTTCEKLFHWKPLPGRYQCVVFEDVTSQCGWYVRSGTAYDNLSHYEWHKTRRS